MKFGMNAKNLFGAVAISALMLSAPIANSPFAMQAIAEVSLQGLPNVADLAEKLLPAVVDLAADPAWLSGMFKVNLTVREPFVASPDESRDSRRWAI